MQDITRAIIIQAAKGNIDAFEIIYNNTSSFVYNIAYRITNNREDAQEIAQDVFLKIYNNLGKFRFKSSFRTWVYRIAVNTSINISKRKTKSRNKTVEYNDTIKINNDNRGELEKKIEKENDEKIIASLLNILNPDQRICIVLRNIEGLNYKEIAETLNININTVRSRLKRAREKLIEFYRKKRGANEL